MRKLLYIKNRLYLFSRNFILVAVKVRYCTALQRLSGTSHSKLWAVGYVGGTIWNFSCDIILTKSFFLKCLSVVLLNESNSQLVKVRLHAKLINNSRHKKHSTWLWVYICHAGIVKAHASKVCEWYAKPLDTMITLRSKCPAKRQQTDNFLVGASDSQQN